MHDQNQKSNPADIKNVYVKGYAKGPDLKKNSRLTKVLNITKEIFSDQKPHRLLDAGCGDGTFAVELGKSLHITEMHGFDISPEAVHLANQKGIKGQNLDIDRQDLPFDDKYFDFIYCGNLIEVVLNPDHMILEFHRVLTDDGRLVITYPNLCAWASRLAVLFGYHPFYDRVSTEYDLGKIFSPIKKGKSTGFIRLFTLNSFKNLIKMHGFYVEKTWGSGEDFIPKPLKLIDNIFSKIPALAFQNICIARKLK